MRMWYVREADRGRRGGSWYGSPSFALFDIRSPVAPWYPERDHGLRLMRRTP